MVGSSYQRVKSQKVRVRFREDRMAISQIRSEEVKELDESYQMVSSHGRNFIDERRPSMANGSDERRRSSTANDDER
ncbi:hypothetical protein GQ457_10G007850 [Hibiscus cannabinus]